VSLNDGQLEPERYAARATRDLWIAVVVVAVGGLWFVSTNRVERLLPTLLRWEKAQLDDLLLTLGLAVAAAGWFAVRRWRDCTRQVRELQQGATQRAASLARLQELSTQLLEAEERERHRLAELLHDDVGQTLYACQLELHLLAHHVQDSESAALLQHATQLSEAALAHARELSRQLSPPELHDLGLQDAILALLPRLEQRYALRMQLVPGEGWRHIPPRCYGPVFHSLQELLLNVAKHARASEVSMSAQHDQGRVSVQIRDDGRGFDPDATTRNFGLFSVERRMACLDGKLEVDSQPGRGTTATLRFSTG
jgi:signal transduction histidine kinase